MTQAYSNPDREDDPHALPDIEVFYRSRKECDRLDSAAMAHMDKRALQGGAEPAEGWAQPGWYWWSCFPGCLPDGDPIGPFATEAEALADAHPVDGSILAATKAKRIATR